MKSPRVKGAVITPVRTSASGSTPATVMSKDLTTTRKRQQRPRYPRRKWQRERPMSLVSRQPSGRSKA